MTKSSSNHEMITSENYGEIFTKNQIIWFLDIANTNNNNGKILIIFNPTTGQSFLKVNDRTSTRDPEQLAAALIRSFPVEKRPNQIIVSASSFQLSDFPNIAIRRSDLQLPLQAFLKMEKIGGVISKATAQSQAVLFNMYGDWLQNISPDTAFFRLVLILRAFDIDGQKARKLLTQTNETIVTGAHHMWPCLSEDQWFKVEVALTDFVVYHYTEKNTVNIFGLTQSEIRDIILGYKLRDIISKPISKPKRRWSPMMCVSSFL